MDVDVVDDAAGRGHGETRRSCCLHGGRRAGGGRVGANGTRSGGSCVGTRALYCAVPRGDGATRGPAPKRPSSKKLLEDGVWLRDLVPSRARWSCWFGPETGRAGPSFLISGH